MHSRIQIDPLNLTPDTSVLLLRYLQKYRKHHLLLRRGKTYWLGLQRFNLTHDIMARALPNNHWHYDVIADEPFAHGKFGYVKEVLAVLNENVTQDALIATPKQKRLYKFQHLDGWHEFRMLGRIPSLRVRDIYQGFPCMFSMRRCPGIPLNEAINRDRRQQPFNKMQRLVLSLNLLRKLDAVHIHGICHRDIRPDNIYYDVVSQAVNIIDFGNSQYTHEISDQRSRGNAVYPAPEEFISTRTQCPMTLAEYEACIGIKSMADIPADIYAMANVLRLVWRDSDPVFVNPAGFDVLIRERILNKWLPNLRLFTGLIDISVYEKQQITDIIAQMLAFHPEDRPSLRDAIHIFEDLILREMLENTPEDSRVEMTFANQVAVELLDHWSDFQRHFCLLEDLRYVIRHHNINTQVSLSEVIAKLAGKWNKRCNYVAHALSQFQASQCLSGKLSFAECLSLLEQMTSVAHHAYYAAEAFEHLPDTDMAVREFVRVLGLSAFSGIDNKAQLMSRYYEIIHAYTYHKNLLHNEHLDLLNKINADEQTIDTFLANTKRIQKQLREQGVYQSEIETNPIFSI